MAKRNKKQNLVKMDLPPEILLEIFSKLPTKSVGKCRTLSKYWNTHLSTNNFINKHLIYRKQTIQLQNLALVTQEPNYRLCIITSPTEKYEIIDDKSFPDKCFSVLGSCNGLILLKRTVRMMLVNPITRKQVTIQPPPGTKNLRHWISVVCGFGYDSCSGDYKIVQICSDSSKVNVYYVKTGVWKRVDGYPYSGLVPLRYKFEGGAFLKGALHWLVRDEKRYRSCIAAFDLANEDFREIPLPKEFVRQGNDIDHLTNRRSIDGISVVGGCLLIVDNHGQGATDVWILKEYGVEDSWVKFRFPYNDDNYYMPNSRWETIVATLCYVEGRELLCVTGGDFLFACDLKGGTMRRVVLGKCNVRYAHGTAFVDSLVSPEGPW